MKYKLIHLIVLGLLIICFTEKTFALEKVTLQLKWYHQFQFAGYYAAVEKGYYEDAGLDVQIIEGSTRVNTIEEVLSNSAQYGISNSGILLHRLKKKPLVVLAAIFQHSPLVILSRKEMKVTNPQALIGKQVRMTRDSRDVELHSMFLAEGITLERIQIIEKRDKLKNYFNQPELAISTYITDLPYHFEQRGIAYNILHPSTYGIDFYGDCLFTSEQELNNHPARVKAFREASLKGWTYAMNHSKEIIKLIQSKYNSEGSYDQLHFEAEMMRKHLINDLIEVGYMNPGRWRHIAETFNRLGWIDTDYSLDGFLYNPDPRPNLTRLYRIIGAILAITVLMGLIAFLLYKFNSRLQKEIRKQKLGEKALKESEGRLASFYKSTFEGIIISEKGRIIDFNNQFTKIFGYERDELIGSDLVNLATEEDREIVLKNIQSNYKTYELKAVRKDGSIISIEIHGQKIHYYGRSARVSAIQDITERKQAEKQIKASLKEKETLLQEIHHRVKNNMTVISSLLSLQANNMDDDRLKDALIVSKNRVESMSAIHEVLYQSENLSSIDMNTHLSKLASAVAQNYTIGSKATVKVESEDILIGTKQASPLGLIINELITNSFKYAFPDNQEGEINIKLQKIANQIELKYADNGIGMPKGFDWHKAKSMGLKLVRTLVENQLDGTIDMESNIGTKFIIKFNIET